MKKCWGKKYWECTTSVCSMELIRWSRGLQLDQFGLNEENDRFFSERQAVLLPLFYNSLENISSFFSIEAISRGDIFRVKKAITTLTMSESCCLLHQRTVGFQMNGENLSHNILQMYGFGWDASGAKVQIIIDLSRFVWKVQILNWYWYFMPGCVM